MPEHNTTDRITDAQLAEWLAAIEAAHEMNGRVARDRSEYRMRIPADPGDTDLVLAAGLIAGEKAVAAVKSEACRADAAERLAEDRRLANEAVRTELFHAQLAIDLGTYGTWGRNILREVLMLLGVQPDDDLKAIGALAASHDEARRLAEWFAAERDYYRAEHARVRQIRHGDPEMFTATLMLELAEEGVTERVRRTVRALWASRRRWQGRAAHTESERDALKARLDAVRVLHRQVPIYPYVDDCSEDHGHDDGHNMVESDDGEWLCTASVPLYFVCDECWDDDCCRTNWPCATVRVLDGLPAYLPPRTVVDVHLPEPGEAVSTDG